MKHVNFVPNEIDIKRFKKSKRINRGSFRFIYNVEEKGTGEFYAVKIIEYGDYLEYCNKMIEREVGIMIIKFIGYSKVDFQEENNVTMIMELVKNGLLADENCFDGVNFNDNVKTLDSVKGKKGINISFFTNNR